MPVLPLKVLSLNKARCPFENFASGQALFPQVALEQNQYIQCLIAMAVPVHYKRSM